VYWHLTQVLSRIKLATWKRDYLQKTNLSPSKVDEASVPCSHYSVTETCPARVSRNTSTIHTLCLLIHFNIILLPTPRSTKRSLRFMFSDQYGPIFYLLVSEKFVVGMLSKLAAMIGR
jgi:hypothetical protein